MGKSKRADKEFTREQRLVKENRQLKQDVRNLRKEISRLDLEGLETARQIFSENEERERFKEGPTESSSNIEDLKAEWQCDSCKNGYLEIIRYPKLGGFWYYRACVSCNKRTVGKKYNESVKGIVKK